MRADYSPNSMCDYVDIPGTPVTVTPVFDPNLLPNNWYTGVTLQPNTPYIPKYNGGWTFTNPFAGVFTDFFAQPLPEFVGYKNLVNPRFSIGCN